MTKCFLCKEHITFQEAVFAAIEKSPELPRRHGRKITMQICANCVNKPNVIRYKVLSPWIVNQNFKSAYPDSER